MKSPYDTIRKPLVTEKSTDAGKESNTYMFVVARDANKPEIKQAVEAIFSVKVDRVNTMLLKGKPKRSRLIPGKKPDWKKAMVTLKEGQHIDVL
ncbi:50S ribosomal protein L23 [Planctomycetota bacterium]